MLVVAKNFNVEGLRDARAGTAKAGYTFSRPKSSEWAI